MESKIRVYGKAQNRTALGIVNAYMVMHPEATLDDLRAAFPDSLNPDSGVKNNFVEAGDKGTNANWDGYFQNEDELLIMGDGTQVALVKMWTKPSFERLVTHAAQYGIEIAQFEEAEKGFGRKGGYRLEYLNGYTPPQKKEEPQEPKKTEPVKPTSTEEPKKKSKAWLWILIIILLLAAAAAVFFAMQREPEVKVVEKVVEKKVVVRDTVFIEKIAEIQDNFNAAQFEKDKAELNDDAKIALHDLAAIMKQNADIKLSIEGHTSSEGDADHNQKLSEQRAKAAVDFLVHREGIDSTRLQAVGKGSTEPIDSNNPEANRRTEFKIIK